MARCETCGNEYDKPLLVVMNGQTHVFDCFECAIQALAPRCTRCHVPIMGHGVEVAGHVFCGASCARESGFAGLTDREAVLTHRG